MVSSSDRATGGVEGAALHEILQPYPWVGDDKRSSAQ